MPDPTLDLEAAAREAGDAPAILGASATMSYRQLLAATAAGPAELPLFTRAASAPSTLLALHAALRRDRSFVPLHPATTAAEATRLADRLLAASPLVPGVYVTTSGSTGRAKIVELPWAALAAHAHAANQQLGLASDDRWLVTLPLSHTGGLSIPIRCLAARAAVVLEVAPALGPAFSAWMNARTSALGVTRLSLVPAQLDRLLGDGVKVPRGLRSVLLGGQAANATLIDRALDAGWPLITSYGLTETCGLCVASAIGERLPTGAVGRALPGVSLRVQDGLLEIDSPARASRVLDGASPIGADGWLRTMDRATLSPDGLVRVLGRADDVIVSAGHKIDPLEVEAALVALPFLAGAVVVGRPDPSFGASLVALVVPAPAVAALDAAALGVLIEAGLTAHLPAYKRPRTTRIVAALPLLPSGKLDRAAAHRLLED